MEELDGHLRECAACAAESLRRVQWKRAVHSAGQRYAADPALRARIQKSISGKTSIRFSWRGWAGLAATAAVVLLLGGAALLQQNTRHTRNNQILSELADLHVATLASAAPVDVVSSDRHTVKPWFAGKIPFSFNLPELQGTPFELVGGRVSYLEQSPGAELIFHIRSPGFCPGGADGGTVVPPGDLRARRLAVLCDRRRQPGRYSGFERSTEEREIVVRGGHCRPHGDNC
jgi:anti-sigma factor RsiW